jgi:ABC-type nitrate/sulfonate/bicarbonate transport system substrate-binding protein
MSRKNMKIEVNNAVFSLPYHVAQEKGLFRDEGLNLAHVCGRRR